MVKSRACKRHFRRPLLCLLSRVGAACALIFAVCGTAAAFEIPTGNENIELRWDNTVKYNIGYRVNNQDQAILKNVNADDGDRNFDRGIVTNRLDLLSELDFQFKKNYGARISFAGWYDQRYHDGLDNDSIATSNHMQNGQPALGLSDLTKRYFAGPDGEILDAFVFSRVDLGPVPVNLKFGRHTVYWGESLLFTGAIHGISYSQMPIDTAKAFAVPGSEAKELFRPLFNVSAQAQLTESFSVAAQQFFQWEAYRFPEAGSYLGFNDALLRGGESLISGPIRFLHTDDVQPDGKRNWGVSARWAPQFLDGTIGIYYRHFADMLPQTVLNPVTRKYFFVYGDDVDLYGVSLSKQILGVSVGTEISYRTNMPLVSDPVISTVRPGEGSVLGARGNTWHGLINFIGTFKAPLVDIVGWSAELTWNRWDTITQGGQYFKGRTNYTLIDRVAEDFIGSGFNLNPTWYQVFPGMDLSMPLSYNRGLIGNSAVVLGGNDNAGNWSAGLSLDVYNRYKFDLKYTDFFGQLTTGPGGAATVANGPMGLLGDRGFVTFTFKTTF